MTYACTLISVTTVTVYVNNILRMPYTFGFVVNKWLSAGTQKAVLGHVVGYETHSQA
jgi:hypothetical protein